MSGNVLERSYTFFEKGRAILVLRCVVLPTWSCYRVHYFYFYIVETGGYIVCYEAR